MQLDTRAARDPFHFRRTPAHRAVPVSTLRLTLSSNPLDGVYESKKNGGARRGPHPEPPPGTTITYTPRLAERETLRSTAYNRLPGP